MAAIQQPLFSAAVVPPLPSGGEWIQAVRQSQYFGGLATNNGTPQSGPAIASKVAFFARNTGVLTEGFTAIPITGSLDSGTQQAIWGGSGSIYGIPGLGGSVAVVENFTDTVGRFNTTANVGGRWIHTSNRDIQIDCPSSTAFGCFITDLGDIGAMAEIDLYNGATRVRKLGPFGTFFPADWPGPNHECAWVEFNNGAVPFNRAVMRRYQYSQINANDPGTFDFIGLDDITIGQAAANASWVQPTEFLGNNTSADAAQTVTGDALAARNAWAAGLSFNTASLETLLLGPVLRASPVALDLTGSLPLVMTMTCSQWGERYADSVSDDSQAAIVSNTAAIWNTSAGGSKSLQSSQIIKFDFSGTAQLPTNFGFYLTNLGQGAPTYTTVRVVFQRQGGGRVCYHVPKRLIGDAAGLLSFWGVRNEFPFDTVWIMPLYYTANTLDVYKLGMKFPFPLTTRGFDDFVVG